jgi:hypothetical protein
LAHFVEFQLVQLGAQNPDDITTLFLSLPEEDQKRWTSGVPEEYKRKPVYDSLLTLCEFAETPTSKFLDVVAAQVLTLISLDPVNPHLRRLLQNIAWTGTQPGAPFDAESLEILRSWLSEVRRT